MKNFWSKNKILLIIIISIFTLNLLLNITFFALNFSLNSDFVANFFTYGDTFKKLIYLPIDNYLYQQPLYSLTMGIFGLAKTVTVVDFIEMSLCFAFFIFFYLKFIGRKLPPKFFLILLAPLFYLINLPNIYSVLEHPFNRTLGLAIIFLFLFFILSRRKSIILWLAFFLLFTAVFFGDQLFIYIFALPLIMAYLVVLLRKKGDTRFSLKIIIFFALAVITSVIIKTIFNKSGYFLIYDSGASFAVLDRLSYNLKTFIEVFLKLFNAFFFGETIFAKKTLLHLANFIILISGIYGLYLLWRRGWLKNKPLTLFIPLSFLITIGAYLFSNKPEGVFTMRFLIVLPFWLCIGLFVLISRLTKIRTIYGQILIVFVILASLMNLATMRYIYHYQTPRENFSANFELVDVLNQNNLDYGYAEYWKAGANTFLSDDKIKIRQILCIEGRIRPFLWVASEKFYEPTNYVGRTFLLLDETLPSCSYQKALDQFGYPQDYQELDIRGKKIELLIFDYNIANRF